jgi:hypothetical protein
MAAFSRTTGAVVALVLSAGAAPAAAQKDIDAAVQKGTDYLKGRFKGGPVSFDAYQIGPTALAGIALLEAKVPANDPVVQTIARHVRDAAYTESKTYQLALCLIFLDRLEDRADLPLIQLLAVRLLAGQNARGGWGYDCAAAVEPAEAARLKAALRENPPAAGKLHAEVEKYGGQLWQKREANRGDDNSNTQFAVLAVWAARKHGVPVEPALDLIEKRFLVTQSAQGGWSYTDGADTPAMTCAGLIGLSVGIARREEQRLKTDAARKDKEPAPKEAKPKDPFFNPPPKPDDGKKAAAKRPADARDVAVWRGLGALGPQFVGVLRGNTGVGEHLYFLWSLERVGVIYGVDKIGGVDWHAVGADAIVRAQGPDGAWGGSYTPEIQTSFAVLFLTRANIARDLSSKVQKDPTNTELRAGSGPGKPEPAPVPKLPATTTAPANPLPAPAADPAAGLAAEVVKVPAAGWAKVLERVRDAKGAEYTRALVLVIHQVDGDRKKQAREALAERLTRMNADTLRGLLKDADAELRRGAVLACAMKDDQAHVPDLIDRLADDEELVVRAARAGLKSLTGQDFGPKPEATKAERKAAADAWRGWWAKQKK